MALRVPIRFNRFLRAFATWVIGFGFVYGIISSLSGSSHDRTDALRSEIAGADSAICVPRAGEGIVGLNRHLRPHVTIDRPSSPYPQLAAGPSLPLQCLEDWLSQGVASCYGPSAGANMKLDVVWTWVNGSDSRWKEVKSLASQEEGIFSPGFHFRDQNELRFSVRSVFDALPGIIRTGHIIVADFPYESTTDDRLFSDAIASVMPTDRNLIRIAQVPHWLDFANVGCAPMANQDPAIQLVTHSDIFRLPSDGSPNEADIEDQWRQKALPSFNSKAIESRIGWVPGLANVVLSFNDDFFLLKQHSVTDFYSLHLGTVIRFDQGYYQQVRPVVSPKNLNDAGETGGLWHANWLLSKRFPKRLRPYLPHVPKVVTRDLHHEAALMFKDELYQSTQRRFRESTKGEGDIQLQWLLISLRVERWREALLWTFLCANLGSMRQDGLVDELARAKLAELLGVNGDPRTRRIEVTRGQRKTLADMAGVWKQAGLSPPLTTELLFSSIDGHLPPIPKPGMPASSTDRCTLNFNECFGSFWSEGAMVSSQELFAKVTFERPDCGDCLIMALVNASGPRGLSAFLPDGQRSYRRTAKSSSSRSASYELPPILPSTNTWQAADFSLDSVLKDYPSENDGIPLRSWTLKLLSRYLYVTGRSASQFHMIASPSSAVRACEEIDNDDDASMLGINDNILYESDETRDILTHWFEKRWPVKGWWERDD